MVEGFMHMDALKKDGKGNFEYRFCQVFEQDLQSETHTMIKSVDGTVPQERLLQQHLQLE